MADSKEMKKHSSIKYISEDVVKTHILPRFPARSLLRFKCVSKGWNSTISSFEFAERRVKISQAFTQFFLLRLGRDSEDRDFSTITSVSYDAMGVKELAPVVCSHLGPEGAFLFLTGCCNGLLCLNLMNMNSFGIWNPVTDQFQQVVHYHEMILTDEMVLQAEGFGYRSSTNDYCIFTMFTQPRTLEVVSFYLFSFNSGSWKAIEIQQGILFAETTVVKYSASHVNGQLFWPRFFPETGFVVGLFCFDLVIEEMTEIPMPPTFVDVGYNKVIDIFEFQGNLSMGIYKDLSIGNIWVSQKDNDGVLTSWVAMYRFDIANVKPCTFTSSGLYLAQSLNQIKLLDITKEEADHTQERALSFEGEIWESRHYFPTFTTFHIRHHN